MVIGVDGDIQRQKLIRHDKTVNNYTGNEDDSNPLDLDEPVYNKASRKNPIGLNVFDVTRTRCDIYSKVDREKRQSRMS